MGCAGDILCCFRVFLQHYQHIVHLILSRICLALLAGLTKARTLLEPLKAKFPEVSYADLYQMASAVAIEV